MRTTLRFDLQSNAFDHFATPPFFLNFFSAPLGGTNGRFMLFLWFPAGGTRRAAKGRGTCNVEQTSTDFVRGSAPEYIFTIRTGMRSIPVSVALRQRHGTSVGSFRMAGLEPTTFCTQSK